MWATLGSVAEVSSAPAQAQQYAGQRLRLPPDGPGSVAGWGRRVTALAIDLVASALVARWVLAFAGSDDAYALVPTLVFVLEASVLTALAGGSFGQLAVRIGVVRINGSPVPLLQAVVRTVLICLVIPPVIYNRDNRGLHDLAVGTVALRRR